MTTDKDALEPCALCGVNPALPESYVKLCDACTEKVRTQLRDGKFLGWFHGVPVEECPRCGRVNVKGVPCICPPAGMVDCPACTPAPRPGCVLCRGTRFVEELA